MDYRQSEADPIIELMEGHDLVRHLMGNEDERERAAW
jgi:hypothetical protein